MLRTRSLSRTARHRWSARAERARARLDHRRDRCRRARIDEAFFTASTHNVYLTDPDPSLANDHAFNRQVVSGKGLIADDQVPPDCRCARFTPIPTCGDFSAPCSTSSHPRLRRPALVDQCPLPHGRELGWHFDNSSFAVTLLLQALRLAAFEYVPAARASGRREQGYETVDAVLDGIHPVETLTFASRDLVLFRAATHFTELRRRSVTCSTARRFAFNDEPGVRLSDSALATFYGRHT